MNILSIQISSRLLVSFYHLFIRVQGKAIQELEHSQTLLEVFGKALVHGIGNVHALAGGVDTSVVESSGAAAKSSDWLTEAESINEDFEGTAGRVEG